MGQDWKYAKWQQPLAAVILEFNPQQLPARAKRAEEAIASRFQELRFEKNNEELRLLWDGLSLIQSIKKDRLGSPE
jgi:surfactin synthase thioesterase subunit